MICAVSLTKQARKQLLKVPEHVRQKLMGWVFVVERKGLEEVRKVPGYHDEPLKGKRAGQRSIRLSRAYRAIYQIQHSGDAELVSVEEVTKHEY